MTRVFKVLSIAGLALVLAACGEQGAEQKTASEAEAKPVSTEELLAQRSQDRWQALIGWDMEKAYAYLSPGTRQALSLPVYMKKQATSPVQMKDAVVKSTQCEESVCTLKLELSYIYQGSVRAMQGQEMTSPVTEKWVMADDNWFYVPD